MQNEILLRQYYQFQKQFSYTLFSRKKPSNPVKHHPLKSLTPDLNNERRLNMSSDQFLGQRLLLTALDEPMRHWRCQFSSSLITTTNVRQSLHQGCTCHRAELLKPQTPWSSHAPTWAWPCLASPIYNPNFQDYTECGNNFGRVSGRFAVVQISSTFWLVFQMKCSCFGHLIARREGRDGGGGGAAVLVSC